MGEISDDGGPYAQYMSEVPCHICHGAKLSPDVLLYHVGDKNYADIEKMELSELNDWLSKFEPGWAGDGKQSMRSRLFEFWYNHYEGRKILMFLEASVVDADGVVNYTALLIRKDHPQLTEIVTEYTNTVKLLNDKPKE